MGRILSIDYGTKRTGIAVTDILQIIANGLETVPTSELWNYLEAYFLKEEVETVIIGEPKHKDGTDTVVTPMVRGLVKKLKKNYPTLKVETVDEQYTSKRAEEAIRFSVKSKKKRKNKGLVDTISAVIILQDYLEAKRFRL